VIKHSFKSFKVEDWENEVFAELTIESENTETGERWEQNFQSNPHIYTDDSLRLSTVNDAIEDVVESVKPVLNLRIVIEQY
jgi:hypothetical protein